MVKGRMLSCKIKNKVLSLVSHPFCSALPVGQYSKASRGYKRETRKKGKSISLHRKYDYLFRNSQETA